MSNSASKKWLHVSQEHKDAFDAADIDFKINLLAKLDQIKNAQKEAKASGSVDKSKSFGETESKPKSLNSYQVYFKDQREKGVDSKEIPKMWKAVSDDVKKEYKAKADALKAPPTTSANAQS